jgi:natural resistance-associated macrophage protein
MAAYIAALIYLAFRKVNAAGLFPSVVSSGTEVEAWRQDGNVDDIGVR